MKSKKDGARHYVIFSIHLLFFLTSKCPPQHCVFVHCQPLFFIFGDTSFRTHTEEKNSLL